MNKPLVVITGASAGIGAATARRFAAEGYPLVLLARRLDRLHEIQQPIKSPCTSLELDVSDEKKTLETIAYIEKEIGPIGILVNNAGAGFGLEPAYEGKLEEWNRCIDINIKGLLYCTRACLPFMVKRNSGHIINLGSVAAHYAYPGGNVYAATKAFVYHFSSNLRADLLGKNIRVSCIDPGLVGGTEFSVVRFRGDEKRAANTYAHTKPLAPEDIAEAIYFSATLPAHVNVNSIEIMPVMQAPAGTAVHRDV